MTEQAAGNVINVAYWNVMLDLSHQDQIAPQRERVEAMAQTIRELPIVPDIIGIAEAQRKRGEDCGEELARLTGYPDTYWVPHSRKKSGEHVGFVAKRLVAPNALALPSNRKAVISQIGDVTIAAAHFKKEIIGPQRSEQAEKLMSVMGLVKKGIIMLDANCIALQRPRKIIEEHGYTSVFKLQRGLRPNTWPTPDYRFMAPWYIQPLYRGKGIFTLDDIYIKNLELVNAGVAVGDSDHKLLYATLKSDT